jgi:hypothetical protein
MTPKRACDRQIGRGPCTVMSGHNRNIPSTTEHDLVVNGWLHPVLPARPVVARTGALAIVSFVLEDHVSI